LFYLQIEDSEHKNDEVTEIENGAMIVKKGEER
jgi:hypothetical protein